MTPSFSSRTYYWYDEKGRKTKCTAPQYVDFVMSLCQKLVTDEEIFPTKYGEISAPCWCRGGASVMLQSPTGRVNVELSCQIYNLT